ncbi:MAG: AMP-binding protein [Brumimicrobium sp.]
MKYKIHTNNKSIVSEFLNFIEKWEDKSTTIQQYTSGSTGKPKNIHIPKWKLKASAKMTGDFFNLNECNNALLCISTEYIGGKMMCVRSEIYNLELHIADISSNPIKTLTTKIDFVAMVPLQVETILKETPEKLDLIKYLIIGGAPVSSTLEKQLQKSKCIAYSTYGMTETVSHIALKRLDDSGSPFIAVGDTTFSSKSDELIIDCPTLKLNSLFANDLISLVNNKSFYWKGRKDFVINTGGIKIHPEKVELKIRLEIDISNFIISSIPDKTLGEKVVLIAEQENKKEIESNIFKVKLNRFEKPRGFYYVNALNYTTAGKIDRKKTKEKILND